VHLTSGKGTAYVSGLETVKGEEGQRGKFRLETVIDCVESYAHSISPAPISARWVVNYPLRSPAVTACSSKDYLVVNVPQDLFEKGADDTALIEKISDVERLYATVNHFVIVTGDKDYRLKIDHLLKNGKYVHLISRTAALGAANRKHSYDSLAQQYPKHFSLRRLEELLDAGG